MDEVADGVDLQVEPRPSETKRLRRLGFLAGAIVLAAFLVVWMLLGRNTVSTDNAYLRASKVLITSEVRGLIKTVAISENQFVNKNDLLIQIDPEPYQLAVEELVARQSEIRAEIEMRKARYREKEIELARAQSRLEYAQRDLDRQETLAKSQVVSDARLDEIQQNRDYEQQTVNSIRQEMVALAAELAGNPELNVEDHPSYLATLAELKQAQLDLARTEIRAPMNGVVSQVPNLRPGAFAEIAKPLFAIVDAENIWVEANLKETQMEQVRIGQPVKITIDAYPDKKWLGTVTSFSVATGSEFAIIPPQNATGKWVKVTQRIPVRIALEHDKAEPTLVVGMSAEVDIDISKSRSTLPQKDGEHLVYGNTDRN